MGDAADDAERRAHEEEVIDAIEEEGWTEAHTPESEMALVIREERERLPAPASILPSSQEWEATMAIAREIASTPFVPESYRGKPESVVAAILTGREMGIGPMQSLRQIHMIDGRPAFAADLMMAKMRAGGVVVIESEVSDTRAYIKAKRKDTGEEAEVEWTLADAEKAGLLSKRNYKTYPADMMWARAVGRLARRLGSDLLGGLVYAKEEMEDWDDSGDGGYTATTARPFDPAIDLLPGAIQGKEAPKVLAGALDAFDPTADWQDFLSQVTKQVWQKESWRELEGEDLQDFWRRLSNAVKKIEEITPAGTFPPVEADKIMAGFIFAFNDKSVALLLNYKSVETPEFVEEKAPISAEQAAEIDETLDDVPWPEPEEER